MEISVPTPDRADRLVDLWLDLAASQRAHGSRLLVEENSDRIRESILYHIVGETLLVAADDEIRGFVMFSVERGEYAQDRDRGVVENLYVEPGYRGSGVGSALLEAAETRLYEDGVDAVALEVLAASRRAREFYTGHGYEPHRIELEKPAGDEPG